MERLEEIRERLEAATDGPWELFTSCSWRRFGSPATGEMVCVPTIQRSDNHPDLLFPNGGQDGPDAELIANAPSDLRALLDVAEAIGKLADDWEEAYRTEFFSEPPERPENGGVLVWMDPNTGEQLSEPFAMDQVSAAMGRFMAKALRRALDDALDADTEETR